MRLNVDKAINSLVDKACTANTTYVDARLFDILDVKALDAKR